MKSIKIFVVFVAILNFAFSTKTNSQVTISSKDISVDESSAVLNLISDEKGFLLPRMETSDRDAISDPAESLIVYNKDSQCIEIYVHDSWHELWCKIEEIEPDDPVFCDWDTPTEIVDVTNPITNRTWMDRNLGASQVATAIDDEDAYGYLFQWGRFKDGHQCRDCQDGYDAGIVDCGNDRFTYIKSTTNNPDHQKYIIYPDSDPNKDWLQTPNSDLWQGDGGINDPCPDGYRLPTEAEWQQEVDSWSPAGTGGAFNSPLKLPAAGRRGGNAGSLDNAGVIGYYWSSDVSVNEQSRRPHIQAGSVLMVSSNRVYGYAVRCIKD